MSENYLASSFSPSFLTVVLICISDLMYVHVCTHARTHGCIPVSRHLLLPWYNLSYFIILHCKLLSYCGLHCVTLTNTGKWNSMRLLVFSETAYQLINTKHVHKSSQDSNKKNPPNTKKKGRDRKNGDVCLNINHASA